MSNRPAGEKEDPTAISTTHAINLQQGHAIFSHYSDLQAKTLNPPMVPINLSSGKTGEGGSLAAIIPQALLTATTSIEIPKPVGSIVTTAAASVPSTLTMMSSTTTPSIPQGSIVQISPGTPTNVSSILRGASTQNPGFASHLPKGAMAAASALAGPKSLTALPMVRHPNVSLQSPGTKVQTASLIRSTTPPTSKSPTPGVTISVTQASEGARTNVTVQNTSTTPQGSIQITLQAPRPSGEGSSKQATIPRTIDVQKPLLQALRTTTVDSVPKTIITTQARPLAETSVKSVIAGTLQRSLETKQAGRQPTEPVIRPPKTIHVPQTSAFSGTKVIVTQASNSSVNPHNLVTNPMKTNKGITIPSPSTTSLSAALSSVTTTTTAIPIAKVPPVRQPPLSLAPHTVSSTLSVTPSTLERPRLEPSNPGTAPPAHTSTTSIFMPHRTQPSTSLTAPSTLTHTERPALSNPIYPYLLPADYLMHYQMQALANVHTLPTISTASTIRPGLLQNQTPNLTASLQAAHTYSGTPGAAVRFNQTQPVVVAMESIRAQQALSGNLPFTASATVPESSARPTTPTDSLSTLSSASAAAASIPIPALTVMGQCNPSANYPSTPMTPQNSQSTSNTPVSTPNASPRPSILRKRTNEGPVKKPVCGLNTMDRHSPRPDSRTDSAPQSNTSSPKTPATPAGESQSSTDTALSSEATTPTQNNMAELKIKQEPMEGLENGLSAAISSSIASLSNSLPNSTDASPRKKPRKQLLNANEELKDAVSSDEEEKLAVDLVKEEEEEDTQSEYREEYVDDEGIRWTIEKCRPNVSLMNFYSISWKPRNNHFNRHTDIKPKEERRPTVNELANQKGAVQKASGWKLYHMAAQMEDLNDLEKTLLSKFSTIQSALSPRPQNKLSVVSMEDELSMMHELTQANIQRCKLIMDQLEESKANMLKVLEHKQKISEIINKHVSKRPIKKKERS